MLRWVGERKCVVDESGREWSTMSIGRSSHSWDEKHFDTSGIVPGAEPIPRNVAKAKKNTPPKSVKGFIALPASEPQGTSTTSMSQWLVQFERRRWLLARQEDCRD